MKQWYLYLQSSFPFFRDYAIKEEIIWSYYHLSSEDKKEKKEAKKRESRNVDFANNT